MIIVLEGIDGCGKGTQAGMLCDAIGCGRKRYPDRKGVFGGLFNRILKDGGGLGLTGESLFPMFLMDMYKDREMLAGFAGDRKRHIVVDRYAHSTLAYQSAQGFDYTKGKGIIERFGIAKPDLVMVLDLPAEESLKRIRPSEIFEKKEFLGKVRENYLRVCEEGFFAGRIVRVDGGKGIDEVHDAIMGLIEP